MKYKTDESIFKKDMEDIIETFKLLSPERRQTVLDFMGYLLEVKKGPDEVEKQEG